MTDDRHTWVKQFAQAKLPHYLQDKADDVAQDIMVRIIKADQRKTTVISNYGYLKRTAMSVMIDYIRKHKIKRALEDDSGDTEPPVASTVNPGAQQSPEAWTECQWMLDKVHGVLSGFAADRQATLLLYLRGMKIKDIALITGFKSAKVRNEIYRGKAELMKQLNQSGINYEVQ